MEHPIHHQFIAVMVGRPPLASHARLQRPRLTSKAQSGNKWQLLGAHNDLTAKCGRLVRKSATPVLASLVM
jgi:hypothetical protein